jgi:hypothetical protein
MTDAEEIFADPAETQTPNNKILHWLIAQGATPLALASPFPIAMTRAVFDGSGRYSPNALGATAIVLPVIDSELIDAAAWSPVSGEIGTRLGIGACLGASQIGVDGLGTTGPALPIWRSPLGWLRAGRRGVVVVDAELAGPRLAGLTIEAEDSEHAHDLRKMLRVPPPTIIVAAAERQVA